MRTHQKTVQRALVTMLALGSLGCAGTPASDSDAATDASAREAIGAQIARHAEAWRRNQVDSVMVLYTEGAVLQFPDAPDARGRDAIREALTGVFAATPIQSLEISQDTLEVFGGVAYEWGTFDETYGPAGQPPIRDEGRYLMRWERGADGQWRVSRFAGNVIRRTTGETARTSG